MKRLVDILKSAKPLSSDNFGRFFISPKIAEQLLELDAAFNRPLSIDAKKSLMQAMIDKEFIENGDTIRFSGENGQDLLIDGKTRLSACRDSGIGFNAIIIWGLESRAIPTIDIGRRRQLYQIIHMMGKPGNGSIASAARMLFLWNRNQPRRIPIRSEIVQPYQIAEAFETFPYLLSDQAYQAGRLLHRKFKILRPSINIAVYALLAEFHIEQTAYIFDAIYRGEDIKEKILFRFREKLIDENNRRVEISSDELVKRFIFVSNVIIQGKDIQKWPPLDAILKINEVL